jgi:hypothetical protein
MTTTATITATESIGVPDLDDDLRDAIAARSDLPDAPPGDIDEARNLAHAAMMKHPSRSGIVTANAIAARLLLDGVVSPALLAEAVAWYARRASRGPGGVCHRHRWLERGRWRDALAGLVVEAAEEADREQLARSTAERHLEHGGLDPADLAERQRDARVREILDTMGERAMQSIAGRVLEDLRTRADAGDRDAGGLLAWLRREPVSAASRSWRAALAPYLDGGHE